MFITVFGQKGGVATTCTSVHLAAIWAHQHKRVALIDDSIVRGTTSKRIVRMLKEAGATEVHVRIASPEYKYSCYYGVDTSSSEELLSHRMNCESAREYIEADSLAFLEHDLLFKAGSRGSLCTACFSGHYPTNLYGIEKIKK